MIVTTNSTRSESRIFERLAAGGGDDLGQAVMVAQVDEQHPAMVALAVDPAGQADGRADVAGTKVGASMGAVGVHGDSRSLSRRGRRQCAEISRRRFTFTRRFVKARGGSLWPART